jgi:hypothetical protein
METEKAQSAYDEIAGVLPSLEAAEQITSTLKILEVQWAELN